jgi:hypothetical protein
MADLTPCDPSRPCAQLAECARTFPRFCNTATPIDASGLRHSSGRWCPMFVDVRGEKLLEAA